MRQICLTAVLFCLSILSASGSVEFAEEGKGFAGRLFTEKKTKSEEKSFWERSEDSPKESAFFAELISNDDDKLYAPPPGEPGNPQKIAPLGNIDIIALLLLSCFYSGYFYRRKKYS